MVQVGDIVHYVSFGTPGGEYTSECRAAVVTEFEEDGDDLGKVTASLAVLNPTGMFFKTDLRYSPDGEPGTWHERLDEGE